MVKEKIFQLNHLLLSNPLGSALSFQLCGTTYPNKSYFINRPHSTVSCIEFVVRGKGHVTIDGQSFSPKEGDTYFLIGGKSQHYYSDKKDPWEKIWINVSGEFVEELAKLYRIDSTYHYPNLDTSDLLLKFQYYATHPDTENLTEKCVSLLSSLFCRMSAHLYAPKNQPETPVRLMLDYIHRHETDVIRIDQLAEACQKSPSQAERLFSAEIGMPPYRYVLNRKIELAKQLLRETGMPIRDVAAYLSFEDEFYFSALFRRKVGMSPSAFRKEST